MPWNLAGRVAVVTGGSGTIGKVIAARLVRSGAHVFVTTRDENALAALKDSIPGVAGAVPCDVMTEKSCEICIRTIVSESKSVLLAPPSAQPSSFSSSLPAEGRIDLLVHCSGVTMSKLLARTTEQDMQALFATNAMAPVFLAKHAIRHGGMLTRSANNNNNSINNQNKNNSGSSGCFIAIGSIVGEDGNAGQVAYSASKGALTASFKSMAKEFGPRGIRFNVVSPGLVDSAMARALREEDRQKWVSRSALGRLITPDEVCDAVMGCCECEGMNGQVVRVDGFS